MNRSVGWYVGFLNSNDWTALHWSQPANRADSFWPNNALSGVVADTTSSDIADMFSGEDVPVSGLDVYDPAFEQDMNTITDSLLSGTSEEPFWFVASGANTPAETTSKSELLNVLQKSKLTQ